MYRREALRLSFEGPWWRPSAVTITTGADGINAVSGEPLADAIRPGRQDHVVSPDQPWLDGIDAGRATIRQVVGAPLGEDATVEGRLTGHEPTGGLRADVRLVHLADRAAPTGEPPPTMPVSARADTAAKPDRGDEALTVPPWRVTLLNGDA